MRCEDLENQNKPVPFPTEIIQIIQEIERGSINSINGLKDTLSSKITDFGIKFESMGNKFSSLEKN